MLTGIRATVKFTTPDVCSLTEFTETADTAIDSISTSVSLPGSEGSVTEFLIDGDVDVDRLPDDTEFDLVFSYETKHLYRIAHDGYASCPCEILGQFGCPIDRYFTENGELTVAFYAADFEQLQDVIAALRDRYPAVDITRLVRSPTVGTSRDDVVVNRAKLTRRQLEVLQTAYEMGYFARPRRANASDVAAELGIDPSTLTEHLAAAQSKLFADVLDDGTSS